MDIFLVILGAVLAIAGGIMGQLVESWLLKKNKLNELTVERQLNACVWIYPLFKKIDAHLEKTKPDFEGAKKTLSDNEEGFWENRLLLPGRCPDAWISCRNAVSSRDKGEALAQAHCGYDEVYKFMRMQGFSNPLKRLTPDK